MGELYDPSEPLNSILYVDANNLYGWAMSQFLPRGGFKLVEVSIKEDWTNFILKQKDEQEEGYFLEVDLEYPKTYMIYMARIHVHLKKLGIVKKLQSEHQKNLGKECGAKYGSEKLCLTLMDKKNYALHYRNLKQNLSIGLKLKRVHRALKFKQSPWLKEYIDMNTEFRQDASNKFEINLYKLMNNKFSSDTVGSEKLSFY